MLLRVTGRCHVCGKRGGKDENGRVTGVPWCSARCAKRAVFGVGDTVVLDSGYHNGFNGIPFKVMRQEGERFVGFVRGKKQTFTRECAAKVGTKRAEAIINRRQIANWKGKTT